MPHVRSFVLGVLLIAIGAAAATWLPRSSVVDQPAREPRATTATRIPALAGKTEQPSETSTRASLERQILMLTAKVVDEAAKRQQLEERVATLTAQLAALGGGSNTVAAHTTPADTVSPQQPQIANAASAVAPTIASSAMERALIAAGVDASTAADLKRRHDGLAMDEIYLRDQATREEWLNTPQFNEELAAINDQRTSIRDEIGDDAYDRYLFAQGQTNRVRVDDVMSDSVASQAGLQAGDILLRYGDTRIFGPDELVNATRAGRAGESIRLEILRNGARLEVQVPRGPLGLRIAASQSEPTS